MSLSACESYYEPNIDSEEPHLVFYGLMTDTIGPQFVKISKSSGYNNDSLSPSVSGFKVIIEEKSGETIQLREVSSGYYVSNSGVTGKINAQYRMIATSPEGKVYTSSYETMLPAAEIDTLSGRYYQETSLVRYDNIGYYEEVEEGLTLMLSSYTKGYTPFYRYEYRLVLETSQVYPTLPFNTVYYIARPYNSHSNTFLKISNGNNYVNSSIIDFPVVNVANSLAKLKVIIKDFELDENGERKYSPESIIYRYNGMLVQVQQYSLSEMGYSFWNSVVKQLDATGQYFDPVESQVTGNIICETDSSEIVYGYFGASSIKIHNQFLYLRWDNIVKIKSIDHFPELSEMICDRLPFDFWVEYY